MTSTMRRASGPFRGARATRRRLRISPWRTARLTPIRRTARLGPSLAVRRIGVSLAVRQGDILKRLRVALAPRNGPLARRMVEVMARRNTQPAGVRLPGDQPVKV